MAITTHDLGQGWYVNFIKDEPGQPALIIRNCDKGLRINLDHAEACRLKEIMAGVVYSIGSVSGPVEIRDPSLS